MTWPKGNFCPKDGTELQDLKRPEGASPASPPQTAKGGASAESASSDEAATRIDTPVMRAAPAAGRKHAAPDARTVLDTPAISADRPSTKQRARPKMVAPSERQLSSRQQGESAAKSEGGGETKPAKGGAADQGGPSRVRGDMGFSETQWFMKGMEVDADLLEMVEQEDYDRDENISEEERKGFTLRRKDED
jgi:hypothetical protein